MPMELAVQTHLEKPVELAVLAQLEAEVQPPVQVRARAAAVIPADTESVTVGRLRPEPGMQALVDQRVDRGIQHLREQDG